MTDTKQTVFLPKTSFPMKAGLAEKEKDYVKHWEKIDLYKKLRQQSKGKEKFILHYGPPYANGHIHIGHALSEVLKDIVNKVKQMQGFDAPLVPGWDCHGLPIEWQIEKQYQEKGKSKDAVDVEEFRKECRNFATKWIDIQKEEFIRLGIVGDFKNPYITMKFETEAAIVEELFKVASKGLLYKGMKAVLWSVVEKTALAEAEVEYKDHVSEAIFVGFKVIQSALDELKDAYAVIWTTTPWSLPGNRAIAYGHYNYALLDIDQADAEHLCGKRILIAEDLLETVLKTLGVTDYTLIAVISGESLEGTIARHPFDGMGYDFDVPFYFGDHVTVDAGTGLVHTAPSHGMEDFVLGKKHGLPIPNTVGPDGIYTHEVPLFEGVHVYKATPPILEKLKEVGCLLHQSKITHSYPHSWRSKAPLIFRATYQWFIDVEKIKDQALAEIKKVEWHPKQGEQRITSMVEGRPDWCISRQRAWGTPITLFVHKRTGDVLVDQEVNKRIIEKIKEKGAEAWYTTDPSEFLGSDYSINDYDQVKDILDVWFDSGCSHSYVLNRHPDLKGKADVYLEGSDQHRGWFQSSLLHSVATTGVAPYKHVVTHGFVLDEKGYKMSKSQGNVVGPEEVIKTYGADILRLWVASVDYRDDVRIGKDILKQLEDIYRRLRNTLRYLLGALDGFTDAEKVSYGEMPELEQYIHHRLYELNEKMCDAIKDFDFGAFYSELHHFCAVDLSAFYFDIRKDSLYCDAASSLKRRAVRTTMNTIFESLVRFLAPVLSFTAEEAYLSRYPEKSEQDSIHLQEFLKLDSSLCQKELAERYEAIRNLRRVMTGALEIERASKTIGSSLQADIAVYVSPEVMHLLENIDIAELAITSKASLLIAQPPASAFMIDDVPGIGVIVTRSEGGKCERCWRVLEEVTATKTLCSRCKEAIHS